MTESGIAVDRLADEIANWNRGQAQTKMSQWLESYRDEIEVVFANNDDMALGAIDALKESDVEHWPLVVGHRRHRCGTGCGGQARALRHRFKRCEGTGAGHAGAGLFHRHGHAAFR